MVRVVTLLIDRGDRHLLGSIQIMVIQVHQIIQVKYLVHDYVLPSLRVRLVKCISFISINLCH